MTGLAPLEAADLTSLKAPREEKSSNCSFNYLIFKY